MTKAKQTWLPVFKSFIEKLRIDSKEIAAEGDKGSKLEMWDSQRIFLEEVCKGLDKGIRTFYCLKSRQLGVSTISLAIDIFWLAMHPSTIGALVTDTETNSGVFRSMIRRYVESFPKGFFGSSFSIVKDNRGFILFSNGSRLDFLVAGTRKKATWGEGRGYSFAHLTECANYGDPAGLESFKEALAETHPNRLFIYESTAKGYNHWHEYWKEAQRDKLGKKGIFIGWWSKNLNRLDKKDPRFAMYGREEPDDSEQELIDYVQEHYGFKVSMQQLAWYRSRLADQSTDLNSIHQNQPWTADQAFVMSGNTFFPIRQLGSLMGRVIGAGDAEPVGFQGYSYQLGTEFHLSKMERIDDMDRIDEVTLRIWHEPSPSGQYVIGCDPAYGRNDHKDRNAISVWRCYADRLVQVAEFADENIDTRQAAWVLAFLAGAYRNCMVNLEVTGPGQAVMTEFEALRRMMNTEMYKDTSDRYGWEDFLSNARWFLYHRPDSMGNGYVKNWKTTFESKFRLCNSMRDSFSCELLEINSAPLIEEMMTIIQDGSTIEAAGTNKDDRCFAAMLANIAWMEWFRQQMISENYTYRMAEAQENGEVGVLESKVNHIVSNFFKTAEEREDAKDDRPAWLVQRGLA